MGILAIEQLAAALPEKAALLGLDLGTKTIGLALSDLTRTIASPMQTIARRKFQADADQLLAVIQAHQIAAMILGLPLNMDGTEGRRCQSTRAFAANLVKRTDCPITFWDERLSTVAAERALIEADHSRARRKVLIDKVAAAIILQGALDRLAGSL